MGLPGSEHVSIQWAKPVQICEWLLPPKEHREQRSETCLTPVTVLAFVSMIRWDEIVTNLCW